MLDSLAPRALVGKTAPMPDPEVRERPVRRTFTAAYKLRIVEEANAVSEPGAVGARSAARACTARTSSNGAGCIVPARSRA